MEVDSGGWLLLSTLQHFAYCPRQASLILEGVWADNHLTAQGDVEHEHVDSGVTDRRRGLTVHHAVPLASETWRVDGVADTVELHLDGTVVPVEYKHGRGAGDLGPTIVQVVGQALCLEEMTDRPVETAAIYISTERRREEIAVERYRDLFARTVQEARRQLMAPIAPSYESGRCRSCSLLNACQPAGVAWR